MFFFPRPIDRLDQNDAANQSSLRPLHQVQHRKIAALLRSPKCLAAIEIRWSHGGVASAAGGVPESVAVPGVSVAVSVDAGVSSILTVTDVQN